MMKIRYSSEEVRLEEIEYQKTHPDLYRQLRFEYRKVKSMNWEDFEVYMKEELAKSDQSKRIKRIGKEERFEFRIPPHSEKGVLRVFFTLGGDCYTIWITDVVDKDNEPKEAKNKSRKKRKKGRRDGKFKKGKAAQT